MEDVEAWLDAGHGHQTAEEAEAHGQEQRRGRTLHLTTWNINKQSATERILDLLLEADIALVQEVRAPHPVVSGAGRVVADLHPTGTRGALVAVAAWLAPLIEKERVSGAGCVAAVCLRLPGFGRVWVASVYAQKETRTETAVLLQELMDDAPLIAGGDWNATHGAADYGGGSVPPPADPWVQGRLRRGTLHDVWRDRNPEAREYTFVRGKSRLDYFLLSPSITPFVLDIGVEAGRRQTGSDHQAVHLLVHAQVPEVRPTRRPVPQAISKEGWSRVADRLAEPEAAAVGTCCRRNPPPGRRCAR